MMLTAFLAQAAQPAAEDPLAGLRANAAPVEVPWPSWVWWCIGAGAVVLVALLVWLGYWLARRKPKTIPPTPRQIAIRELEALRASATQTPAYEFSIAVSDVLRTFVSGQFGIRATQQTSPEFLATLARSTDFTEGDRALLEKFLERCDLIKFARIEAHHAENEELLRSATAFVQGARA